MKLHVPPPLWFAAAFGAGFGLQALVPVQVVLPDWAHAAAWTVVALAAAGVVSAVIQMWRVRTSILPYRRPAAFVVAGPYRFTRNPMYLMMVVEYLSLCAALDLIWPLATLPLAIFALQRLVIRGEERVLEQQFGDTYREYAKRVRRWI